ISISINKYYGDVVKEKEPLEASSYIIAGSLIKNPGGALVPARGYKVGREDLIHKSANRLTAPGLGKETGATLPMLQEMYQGFFMAPHIVGESLQGAVFTARLMQKVGIYSTPFFDTYRTDI